MKDIVGKRKIFYIFSTLIIIPGIISLMLFGLNLSIDFTGGSRSVLTSEKPITQEQQDKATKIFQDNDIYVYSAQKSDNFLIIRTAEMDQKQNAKFIESLKKANVNLKQESFESIGPTIGGETTTNAIKAVIVATLLIVIYIAISFRKVPKPASSWKFGVGTVIALIHDVFFLLGVFSILGYLYKVEVDSLFITAVLTVIGFSVHDTIVVYDRIRENLIKTRNESYKDIINDSILQTMTRSLNTSLTALLVLFTLLLFGGESLKWFIFALFIGIAVGTYSSIFIAAPLLYTFENLEKKFKALDGFKRFNFRKKLGR